jgi:hypothetical protein
MMLPFGTYRYELRSVGTLVAFEEERITSVAMSGTRRSVEGANRQEVEATFSADGLVQRVSVRYQRGPFNRTAVYDADGDTLRGRVSAVAGRNEVVVALGRYREIDAGLTFFKALIIAHIRARGAERWTGRVAVIDPNTLVAASLKQTCSRRDDAGRLWVYELRMGETETIEIDAEGRIIRGRDDRGVETVLVGFDPAA